jgi:hypothetical protein
MVQFPWAVVEVVGQTKETFRIGDCFHHARLDEKERGEVEDMEEELNQMCDGST